MVGGSLLGSVLPTACPVCGAVGAAPCAACWTELRAAPAGPIPAGLDRCGSLLAYEGAGRELVARLKYRNARGSVEWLAAGMAALASAVDGGGIDLVTWAPTTAARRRQRGYDHAEVLARAVGRRLSRPVRPMLTRLAGPPQTGRGRAERWHDGPAFVPRKRGWGWGAGSVLVVDDLLTTGATLTAAAAALRSGGARSVVAVTAGRTPFRLPPAVSGR